MSARIRLSLLAGGCGIALMLLGYTARYSTAKLLEVPSQSWGMTHLSDAVVAGTCTIGALGALWHMASAVIALVALSCPRDHALSRQGDDPGLAARILDAWGAPAIRRIAASTLVLSLSSAPALAAEAPAGGDDLGWRPTSSTPLPPSQSPTPSPQAGQSPSGSSPTVDPDSTQPLTGSAASSPPPTPSDRSGDPTGSAASSTAGRRTPEGSQPGAPSGLTHTVLPGESLWSITTQLLPAGSSPAQISQSWPALYHANADAIGADPSLIRPGTVVIIPSALVAQSTTTGGPTPTR